MSVSCLLLPGGGGIYLRTTKTNSLDTESQKLENVGSVANTTVGNDLGLLKDLGGVAADLVGDLERRGRVVDLTSTVVGEPDTFDTLLDGLEGILYSGDTLENDGKLGVLLDLIVEISGQSRSDTVAIRSLVAIRRSDE